MRVLLAPRDRKPLAWNLTGTSHRSANPVGLALARLSSFALRPNTRMNQRVVAALEAKAGSHAVWQAAVHGDSRARIP